MRYLCLLLTLFTSSPASARETVREPLKIEVLPTVTEEGTRQAGELLRGHSKLSPVEASSRLAALLKGCDLPRDVAGPWFELIAKVGGPLELQQIYVGLVTSIADDCCEGAPGADFDTRLAFTGEETIRLAARSLIDAAEKRGVRPASPYRDGRLHLGSHMYWQCPEGMAGDLAKLAALFKVTEDYEVLARQLGRADLHRGAYEALLLIDPKEAADLVEDHCLNSKEPLGMQGALLLLARTAPDRALPYVARILSAPMDEASIAHLWKQLLEVNPFVGELASALPRGLPAHVKAAGRKVAIEAGLDQLAKQLEPAAFSPASDFAPLAEDSRLHGDPARGEIWFRSYQAGCAECHTLGGVGSGSGPDLARVGQDRSPGEIVSAVLQPSARTTEKYKTLLSGEATEQSVRPGTGTPALTPTLLLASHPPKGVKSWPPAAAVPFPGSSMPTGLLDSLALQDVRDLFSFLLKLGAAGGLDAENRHVARQWRIESDSQTSPGGFINRENKTGGTGEVRSLINGNLRREDCLAELYDTDQDRVFYVGAFFTVPGEPVQEVRFRLTGIEKAWIDGKPLDIAKVGEEIGVGVQLAPGNHRIDVRLVPHEMREWVRVEADAVEFATEPLYPRE